MKSYIDNKYDEIVIVFYFYSNVFKVCESLLRAVIEARMITFKVIRMTSL